jgi:hypothetical protein
MTRVLIPTAKRVLPGIIANSIVGVSPLCPPKTNKAKWAEITKTLMKGVNRDDVKRFAVVFTSEPRAILVPGEPETRNADHWETNWS